MLIPLRPIINKYKLDIKGVIHIGAHWGQEHQDYLDCGINKMIYIEPCLPAFNILQKKFNNNINVKLINCACGDQTGTQIMYTETSNAGQSNSLLKPKFHLDKYPHIQFNGEQVMSVYRLDDLEFIRDEYDILLMDCQGYEGYVLRGGFETLKNIKVVYTEVNNNLLYEDCTLLNELDEILFEFDRVETIWVDGKDWGDAIYIRK